MAKSRLVTGIRVSNNNRAMTVLDLFHEAVETHGLPSRVRGDHGTENILVAIMMETERGIERGSYIWGRSVQTLHIPLQQLTPCFKERQQYAHRASVVRCHPRLRPQVEAVLHSA